VDGERFTVWATSLVEASIDSKWDGKGDAKLFIKSLGEKKSSKGPFSYYNYIYKTV